MKLNQLRIFVCASRHLNLSNAALELGMSQPAVSLQMKKLEDEFGVKLYRASNRGIELTQQGHEFVESVRPLIEKLDHVERRLKSGGVGAKARLLTIGGTHTLTETVLLQRLVHFRKNYPDVRVNIETGGSSEVEEGVRSARIDIALISGPSHFRECHYEEFGNQEMVAFVGRGHFLGGRTLTLPALMREPLVTKKGGTCVKRLLHWGLKPNIALECAAADAVKAAVIKGLGVGLLFRARIAEDIARGDLHLITVPELKKLSRKSFIVYQKREGLSKAGLDFLADLRRQGRSAAQDADAKAKPAFAGQGAKLDPVGS
jgi:DNA-binding transcriptional LysR family regulator